MTGFSAREADKGNEQGTRACGHFAAALVRLPFYLGFRLVPSVAPTPEPRERRLALSGTTMSHRRREPIDLASETLLQRANLLKPLTPAPRLHRAAFVHVLAEVICYPFEVLEIAHVLVREGHAE